MSTFADSSAVVKLYADEERADAVRSLRSLVVSLLVRVEVPAALWRKMRTGAMSADEAAGLVREFEADFGGRPGDPPRFAAVAVTPGIVSRAALLTATHALRGYDAVQLASAMAARAADPDCRTFACFDARLSQAAAIEGFDVSLA